MLVNCFIKVFPDIVKQKETEMFKRRECGAMEVDEAYLDDCKTNFNGFLQ